MSIIPYINRSTDLLQLTVDFPLSGAIVAAGTKFSWYANSFVGNYRVHFNVEISTDAGYTSLVKDSYSRFDAGSYEYETSPNVWAVFPIIGLTSTDYQRRVRYNPGLLATNVYFWRVRVEQIY